VHTNINNTKFELVEAREYEKKSECEWSCKIQYNNKKPKYSKTGHSPEWEVWGGGVAYMAIFKVARWPTSRPEPEFVNV
jgi:hypothetical protein